MDEKRDIKIRLSCDVADPTPPEFDKLGYKVFESGTVTSDVSVSFSNLVQLSNREFTFEVSHGTTANGVIYTFVIWAEQRVLLTLLGMPA